MTPVHLPAIQNGARGGTRNPNPRVTNAVLCRLSCSGMERMQRIELCWPERQSGAQPIGHTREIWSGRRYSKSLLWGGGPGHILYTTPAYFTVVVMRIQLSKNLVETQLSRFTSQGREVRQKPFKSLQRNKKRGGHFLVAAPFLEIGCYSKTVKSPREGHYP